MIAIARSLVELLFVSRYIHFFVVGVTGVALNLGITIGLTELYFGREQYFSAYLIGLTINLLYNFALHTFVTFKTTRNHSARLAVFLLYSVTLAYIQTRVVRYLTDLFGVDWYALVIAAVIMLFSAITFILFKLILFKEDSSQIAQQNDITTH